jgi:hypothetical protein
MWEKVSSRSHNPMKIFPFGSYSDELMLHGTVKYGMKAGGEKELDWAARVHLVKVDGKVKMDFYQVYLVSGTFLLDLRHGELEQEPAGVRFGADMCAGYWCDGVIM